MLQVKKSCNFCSFTPRCIRHPWQQHCPWGILGNVGICCMSGGQWLDYLQVLGFSLDRGISQQEKEQDKCRPKNKKDVKPRQLMHCFSHVVLALGGCWLMSCQVRLGWKLNY
ncbi:hypothetical protein LIA77_11332 [Sarocladium implicatum]|nr:hypothetical protein LIA77_11332 [Sarocladium implicatum]